LEQGAQENRDARATDYPDDRRAGRLRAIGDGQILLLITHIRSHRVRRLLACAWLVAVAGCGPGYPESRSGADYRMREGASQPAESVGEESYSVPLEIAGASSKSLTLHAAMSTSGDEQLEDDQVIRTAGAPIAPPDATLAQQQREPVATSAGAEPPADTAHRPALIYDARLQLAVFEAEQAVDAAERLAQDNGGYLVHRGDRVITFRVPAERFQSVLASATQLGDVLHREVSVRDVSDELRDLELRLRNAAATRDRLEQLLNRADKVQETLEVARELDRVVGEIEQIKGRLKVLNELVAFSTITLQFEARSTDQVDSTVRLPFPWLDHLGLGELLRL
jgi:hypothetical protein